MHPFFAFMPRGMDWFWILLLVILLFGAAKIPNLARSLGKSMKEFKKGQDDAVVTDDATVVEAAAKKPAEKTEDS